MSSAAMRQQPKPDLTDTPGSIDPRHAAGDGKASEGTAGEQKATDKQATDKRDKDRQAADTQATDILAGGAGTLSRLLRAVIEASPANIAIADATRPDRPLILASDAFYRTTGYTAEEVIGRNCSFLQGPDTDHAEVARIRAALDEGRAVSTELLNYRKDGTPFWNRLDLAPVFDDAGALCAYVGVQHDTTAERRATAHERQRQKMESLGRLAGGVAHEINNLLQPAVSLPELVADGLSPDMTEEREMLSTIADHAREARRVADDILRFARAERPEIEGRPLLGAVSEAIDFVTSLMPASIAIRRAGLLAEGRCPGMAALDTGELRQVLANLMSNAAAASGETGAVEVSLAVERDTAVLSVRDWGSGIDPAIRDRIFEPYFTTKAVGEGTGLGLSIVYGLVQRWGGEIDCADAPERGTVFHIRLPLVVRNLTAPVPAAD